MEDIQPKHQKSMTLIGRIHDVMLLSRVWWCNASLRGGELTNMIWASMHDFMTGLLYYDVEVFIFPCLVFLLSLLFRQYL
jgi:hypothetical protein